jgi:hypothetical protein
MTLARSCSAETTAMVKKAVCFRAVMATTRFRRWSLGSQVAEIRDHTSWRVGE